MTMWTQYLGPEPPIHVWIHDPDDSHFEYEPRLPAGEGYGLRPGAYGACEVVRFFGATIEVLATIPDASPLMPGDLLGIELNEGTVRFFVNRCCVWTVTP